MPEIGEIARIVHYLRKHAVGKTIAKVTVQQDEKVFNEKVGTTAAMFEKAITGKKVLGAQQQGKYFWLEMSSPPHPLMHFGMNGWMKFSNDDSSYYKPANDDATLWPPKFWKFVLQTAEDPKAEIAFIDSRRFARIRLVDVSADKMRLTTPLKENGPDPVVDKDAITIEWLTTKLRSKKVPVKALLLDQANISGIGNWVGDEIMYQSRIHPEQYSNSLSDAQIKKLHEALIHVCTTACSTLADSSKFPENWLMKHRWGKGKKDSNKLPNGDKIVFVTVGGRTSAVVPSVQKKSGPVAGDIDDEDEGSEEASTSELKTKTKKSDVRPKAKAKSKAKAQSDEDEDEDDVVPITAKTSKAKSLPKSKASQKENGSVAPKKRGRKQSIQEEGEAPAVSKSGVAKKQKVEPSDAHGGSRRRSMRLSAA